MLMFNFNKINYFFKKTIKCLHYRLKKSKFYFNLNSFFNIYRIYSIKLIKNLTKFIIVFLYIYLILFLGKFSSILIIRYFNWNRFYIITIDKNWVNFNLWLQWLIIYISKLLINSSYFFFIKIIELWLLVIFLFKYLIIQIKFILFGIINYLIVNIIVPLLGPIVSFSISLVKSFWNNDTREVLDEWFNFSYYEVKILLNLKQPINFITYQTDVYLTTLLTWALIVLTEKYHCKQYFVRLVHLIIGFLLFYINIWILLNTSHDEFTITCILMVSIRCWISIRRFYFLFKEYKICLGFTTIIFLFSFLYLAINLYMCIHVKYILQVQIYKVISSDPNDPIQLIFFRYVYYSNYAREILLSLWIGIYILVIRFYIKNYVSSFLNFFYVHIVLKTQYVNLCKYILKKKNYFFFKIRLFFLCESEIDPDNPYLPIFLYNK